MEKSPAGSSDCTHRCDRERTLKTQLGFSLMVEVVNGQDRRTLLTVRYEESAMTKAIQRLRGINPSHALLGRTIVVLDLRPFHGLNTVFAVWTPALIH
jgi:hypothetical protein